MATKKKSSSESEPTTEETPPEETSAEPTKSQRASVSTESSSPVVIPDPTTIRGPIELSHNKTRDDREKQYVTDRMALDADYHSDLADIQTAKQTALANAGLNPDGSTPSDYGWPVPDSTSTET
jgi:hypothetical protein